MVGHAGKHQTRTKERILDGFYPQSLIVPGEINSPDYRPTSNENPLEYDVIPIPVISTTADKIATWKPEEKIETRFSLNTNEVSLLVVKNKQIIFQAFLKRKYNTWKRSGLANFHLDYAKMISKEVFINKRQLFALKFIYDQRSMPQFLLLFKEKDQFFMFDRVYYKYVPFSNHIKEPHNCLN